MERQIVRHVPVASPWLTGAVIHPAGAVAAEPAGLAVFSPTVVASVEIASFAVSAYHGYKRNNSIGWALWWGIMGGLFPIFTPVIAVAQGFGKPIRREGGSTRRRARR